MGNMSKKQVEVIAVVALALVAMVMAYVRFGRKPAGKPSSRAPAPEAASSYEIPALPDWLEDESSTALPDSPAYAPPSRDLFAPADKKARNVHEAQLKSHSPDGQPVLTGTIRSARGALAIINGRVVGAGEKIDGYTVLEIRDDEVVLLHEGRRIVVKREEE